MADKDGLKVAKDYHTDVPFGNQGSFHVKGANNTDWGMKRHLSNIFDPVSGNTVMYAFDHGYFMGNSFFYRTNRARPLHHPAGADPAGDRRSASLLLPPAWMNDGAHVSTWDSDASLRTLVR